MTKSLMVFLAVFVSGVMLAGCSRQQGISVTAPAEPQPVETTTTQMSSPSPLPSATDLTSLEGEIESLTLEEESFE